MPVVVDRSKPTFRSIQLDFWGRWTNQNPSLLLDVPDLYKSQFEFTQSEVICSNTSVENWKFVVKEAIDWYLDSETPHNAWCHLICDPWYIKVWPSACKREFNQTICRNGEEFWFKSYFKPKEFPADWNQEPTNSSLPPKYVYVDVNNNNLIDWQDLSNIVDEHDEETINIAWDVRGKASYYSEVDPLTWYQDPTTCLSCQYECPTWYHKDPYTEGEDKFNFECVKDVKNIKTPISYLDYFDVLADDSYPDKNITGWNLYANYSSWDHVVHYSWFSVRTNYSSWKKYIESTCEWMWKDNWWQCKAINGASINVAANVPFDNPFGWFAQQKDINSCYLWNARVSQCILTDNDNPTRTWNVSVEFQKTYSTISFGEVCEDEVQPWALCEELGWSKVWDSCCMPWDPTCSVDRPDCTWWSCNTPAYCWDWIVNWDEVCDKALEDTCNSTCDGYSTDNCWLWSFDFWNCTFWTGWPSWTPSWETWSECAVWGYEVWACAIWAWSSPTLNDAESFTTQYTWDYIDFIHWSWWNNMCVEKYWAWAIRTMAYDHWDWVNVDIRCAFHNENKPDIVLNDAESFTTQYTWDYLDFIHWSWWNNMCVEKYWAWAIRTMAYDHWDWVNVDIRCAFYNENKPDVMINDAESFTDQYTWEYLEYIHANSWNNMCVERYWAWAIRIGAYDHGDWVNVDIRCAFKQN